MRADPEEFLGRDSPRDRFPLIELLIAVALIAGLVVFWFWSQDKQAAQAPAQIIVDVPPVAAPATAPELPATPDIPQHPQAAATVTIPDAAVTSGEGAAVDSLAPAMAAPLRAAEGDELLRQQLAAVGGAATFNRLAKSEQPVEVSAAFIDGLGRGIILRTLLPADPPKQAFSVTQEGGTVYMSSASYERYDAFTDAVTALDSGVVLNAFHTLRPLYEQAYEHLGLDPGDFDNAVIRTLDLVLATPEITEPLAVRAKSAVYTYVDPTLENLPAVQKQLLRTGPDNLRRLKQQARLLREGLLAQ